MVCSSPCHTDTRQPLPRLNLLLSDTDWREQCFAEQLPRLLSPMGVATYRVQSGREAEDLIRQIVVHVAVVDLRLPLRSASATTNASPPPPPPPSTTGPAAAGAASGGTASARPGAPVGVPRPGPKGNDTDGGIRILQILRRLEAPPPTVVVRGPADRTLANQRTLREALREGAFAVIDSPVQLEVLLETLRRILRRHYADAWPEHRPRGRG